MKLFPLSICLFLGLNLAFYEPALAGKKNGGGGGGKGAHANGGVGHGGGGGGGGQHHARMSSIHNEGQAPHAGNGNGGQHGLNSHNNASARGLNGKGEGGLAAKHNGKALQRAGNNHLARVNARHYRNGYHWRNSHVVFANYHRVWHDHFWWHSHYDVVVFGTGWGPWYWDAGYWYPAWGYDPAFVTYGWDIPVYAYANLPPDQVVVNVQEALQDQGYYGGDIDGQLGQQTRDALAQYQREHSLEVTAAIDEPTVTSLGLANEQA
jgi:hypothetical protein